MASLPVQPIHATHLTLPRPPLCCAQPLPNLLLLLLPPQAIFTAMLHKLMSPATTLPMALVRAPAGRQYLL